MADLPDDFPVDRWQAANEPLYQANGCEACRGTGYRGRMGIYELLESNTSIRALANERATSPEIKQAAMTSGMTTLREDGWAKALTGMTTIDEVLRVTKSD